VVAMVSVLPDGLFSYQKVKFWVYILLKALVWYFFVVFMTIWYFICNAGTNIVLPFGIFLQFWYIFPFLFVGILNQGKTSIVV
jgi:hypothetical protein